MTYDFFDNTVNPKIGDYLRTRITDSDYVPFLGERIRLGQYVGSVVKVTFNEVTMQIDHDSFS